jgi:Fic family protein
VGAHRPPQHYQIVALMDDFINEVNRHWDDTDPLFLATYVYWKINYIHPFINGNGRTARVAVFYVLCLKNGGFIKGSPSLPALLRREKDNCCKALQHAHDTYHAGAPDLVALHKIFVDLMNEQVASVANNISADAIPDVPVAPKSP